MNQRIEDRNPRLGARKRNSREEARRGDKERKRIKDWESWMKRSERKILETPAKHAKKSRECKGKGIKLGRGNEETNMYLLHKALIGHGRVMGGLDFSGGL